MGGKECHDQTKSILRPHLILDSVVSGTSVGGGPSQLWRSQVPKHAKAVYATGCIIRVKHRAVRRDFGSLWGDGGGDSISQFRVTTITSLPDTDTRSLPGYSPLPLSYLQSGWPSDG
jgi:hypothetical protein